MYETDALAVPGVSPAMVRWPRWAIRNEQWNEAFQRHRLLLDDLGSSRDLQGLYHTFAQRSGARFFGEKAPAYSRWLAKVSRSFPAARFVIVLRELPEIYQSVCDAGERGSRFFRRPGQLPRIIWSHRVFIREIARQRGKSTALFTVRYREVVDDVATVARRICQFLEIDFDEAMTSLKSADLSAVYHAPHHEQVRKAIIRRRSESRGKISEKLEHDLRTFSQLSGQPPYSPRERVTSISARQRISYFVLLSAGGLLCGLDDMKRLLYEYLPVSWFRFYRSVRARGGIGAEAAIAPQSESS